MAFAVGIPLGRVAARYRDRLPDVALRLFAVLGYAMPVFFLGLLLKLLFAIKLGWLPPSGRASANVEIAINDVAPNTHIYLDQRHPVRRHRATSGTSCKHAILPASRSACSPAGIFLRLVRVNLLQTLRADYVEAARARGVPERPGGAQARVQNALIPVVTVMGLQIAALLGGAVLTETTFEWQGLGYKLVDYLQQQRLHRRAGDRHRDRRRSSRSSAS